MSSFCLLVFYLSFAPGAGLKLQRVRAFHPNKKGVSRVQHKTASGGEAPVVSSIDRAEIKMKKAREWSGQNKML